MARITEETILAGYKLAKRAYEGDIAEKDAILMLARTEGMVYFSAAHFIVSFRKLIRGEAYKQVSSRNQIRCYLENVLKDYGEEVFKTFLKGLALNIEYTRMRGHHPVGMCTLHNEFSKRINIPLTYESTSPHDEIKSKDSYRAVNSTEAIAIKLIEDFNKKHKADIERRIRSANNKVAKSRLYSGKFIVRLEQENPRQFYSWGYRGYELLEYLVPMSYEDYKRLGARNNDIAWDLAKKFTEHFDSLAEAEAFCNKQYVESRNFQPNQNEDNMEIINFKPSEIKNDVEAYTIDSIVKDGCFIEKEELESFLYSLEEKKNLILQGPPGTGKTWLAKKLGYALIGKNDKRQVMSVQFHPNMSYEDFVMGYRPNADGKLEKDFGIFMKFVEKARDNLDEQFVMVIEEINRGNPAQIFGEMLTLLEADKRIESEKIRLCYQDEYEVPVYIPENFFVIGTMNLADRSLAVVDFALRRRFAFIDLEPQFNSRWLNFVKNKFVIDKDFAEKIQARMKVLNDKIRSDASLGKQFCIGHSFFTPRVDIDNPKEWYRKKVNTEIRPLLEEYWFDAIEKNYEGEATKTKTEFAVEELLAGI